VQVQLGDSLGPLTVQREDESQEAIKDQPSPDIQLVVADITLDQPPQETYSRHIKVRGNGSADPIAVDFELWQVDGPNRSDRPAFRYPATISIVTSRPDLDLALIDEAGQAWPATSNEANLHTFVIGPRWQSGTYRLRVSLRDDLGQTVSEPLLEVENWWERRFEAPVIETALKANFANQVMLLGYHLPRARVKAGESFPITLYWQAPADRSPQASFTQFNHLLDSQGRVWGGYDRWPLEYYDTLLWAPGEIVVDGYTVPVDANAPPGQYYLNVGYYLTVGESAVNLPLVENGQMTDPTSVTIGPVEIRE
jgi:hypothetical protein